MKSIRVKRHNLLMDRINPFASVTGTTHKIENSIFFLVSKGNLKLILLCQCV